MSPVNGSVFSDGKRKRTTIILVSVITAVLVICGLIAASRAFGWLQSKDKEYLLTIIDLEHPVDDDWSPEFMMLEDGQLICSDCAADLDTMLRDCRTAGGSIRLGDCYRSESAQQRVLDEMIEKLISRGVSGETAAEEAARLVGLPGTSEHQLGYAVDIYVQDLKAGAKTEDSYSFSWLSKNSWKYGFILRLTEETDQINTELLSDAQSALVHLRFVGQEAASQIYELGVTLEDYIQMFYS